MHFSTCLSFFQTSGSNKKHQYNELFVKQLKLLQNVKSFWAVVKGSEIRWYGVYLPTVTKQKVGVRRLIVIFASGERMSRHSTIFGNKTAHNFININSRRNEELWKAVCREPTLWDMGLPAPISPWLGSSLLYERKLNLMPYNWLIFWPTLYRKGGGGAFVLTAA